MSDDVLELVRAADPLAGQPLPSASDPDAVAMRERIVTGQAGVADLDRHRRRRAVAVGVAIAVAAAAAAAIAVSTRQPTQVHSIGCYVAADTGADTAVVSAVGDNPVVPCRQLWESGEMDPAVDDPADVPTLVACVLESGSVGVFPAPSCDRVTTTAGGVDGPAAGATSTPDGVTASPTPTPSTTPTTGPGPTTTPDEGLAMPDFQTSDQDVRTALNEIRLAMLDRCLTLEAATGLAHDVLAAHGLEGWTIEPIFDGHTDATCAGFFPSAPDQAIWWTPEPAGPDQTPGPR